MEIIISIGLGCWFVFIGILATVQVYKDFNKAAQAEDKV